MIRQIATTAAIAAVGPLVTLQGSAAHAQAGALYTVVVPAGEFGSPAFAGVLVGGIAAVKKFCSQIGDDAYHVDCLAERLSVVAAGIPQDSDYADVRKTLLDTSAKLSRLARSNRDAGLPRANVTQPGAEPVTTTRPLTPVARSAVPRVNQQAVAILEETETILLRSADNSEEKLAQYTRIAEAVGSNKVLLRAS